MTFPQSKVHCAKEGLRVLKVVKKISMLFPIFSQLSNCNSYNFKKSEEKVSQITFKLQEMLREKKLARNVL